MNNVNWDDALFLAQMLVFLGAACWHLKLCMLILFAEIAIVLYIIFPLFILWAINVIFGGEVCFIVILLAIGIGIYYFHLDKEMNKNK